MQYLVAHHLHVACVTLSIALFILRGGLMLAGSPRLRSPVLRVLPHLVDTTLLASALWLVSVLRLPVFATPWLMAKLTGVVAYIVIGGIALRRGRSYRVRVAALVGAIVVVAWVVSVALHQDPRGFLVAPG